METTKTIAKINGVSIQIIENGEKRIAIKPICEALGISYEPQFQKLKEDDFLASTIMLSIMVGADGRQREMSTIPYKYVFGWLFTINPKNVKLEAQEAVTRYRIECYDVLYNHFTEQGRFLDEQKEMLNIELDKLKKIKENFKEAKEMLYDQQKKVDIVRHITFEEWKNNNRQLIIPFVD